MVDVINRQGIELSSADSRSRTVSKDQHVLATTTTWQDFTTDLTSLEEIETTIIIPAYNEEEALPLVLRPLFNVIDETYEVLVVDDGSTDNSAAVAANFPCRVIQHVKNAGKGAAMRTGMLNSNGKKVIFIDADNTYPVEMIPAMVKALDDHDMVRGLRLSGRENIPLLNRLGNSMFDMVIRVFHAVEGGDLLSGMYGGYRDMLLDLDLESEGFAIEAEINVKARAHGMSCTTMPITYVERVGDKKLRPFQDGMRILYRVLQLAFTHNPMLMFILPGHLLVAIGAFGLGGMLIGQSAGAEVPLHANSLFLLSVLLLGGIQLVFFGLAIYEAGMAYGLRGRAHPLLDRMSKHLRGRGFMITGFVLSLLGFTGLMWEVMNWLFGLPMLFSNPVMSTLVSLSLMFAVQILSSSAFLSALRGLQINPTRRVREI